MSKALRYHAKFKGKIATKIKVPLRNEKDLSLAYSPGVAEPCLEIARDPELVNKYTSRGNTVAIVTDGSAVLGLGNIGPLAAIPVMEGKAILFKKFADIDAVPICLNTQDPKEIVKIVKNLEPSFGGINLEDISSPRCFEIEQALRKTLGIPVFHDDQHGTAIVTLAGLINASKVKGQNIKTLKVVVSGAGAAGTAITRLLLIYGIKNVIVVDAKGIIKKSDKTIGAYRKMVFKGTNLKNRKGSLKMALKGADVFIGVSVGCVLTVEMIKEMRNKPIVFAMANPNPEISPKGAKEADVFIFATGRSDYPNQINNLLAFPGIFKGAFQGCSAQINKDMRVAAAEAIASMIKKPTVNKILPSSLNSKVTNVVARAVKSVCPMNKKMNKHR